MQPDNQRRELMRTLTIWAFVIVAVLTFAGAAIAEPYSVEDAINEQWIGSVDFTPDGAAVAIAYANAASENRAWNEQLFWADLRGGGNGRPLFSQEQGEGYAHFSPSLDSHYAAYVHYRGDSLNAAVYDFRSRRSIEIDAVPDAVPYWTWISDHEVMFWKVLLGAPQASFIEQMPLQWRKMREGRSTTGSPMGSGRYAARPEDDSGEGIVIADIRTGAIQPIVRGRVLDQAVSPDGTWLAVIRRLPALLNPQSPMVTGADRGPVALFSVNRDGAQRKIYDSPNAVPGSLLWSPSGRHLAFLTLENNGSTDQSKLWICDAVNGTAHRVETGDLLVSPLSNNRLLGGPSRRTTSFAWLGEELTVMAQAPAAPRHALHAYWFLLRSGFAPINLTAQFDHVPEIVAITKDALLMSADGQVWEIRASQKRRLLAGSLGNRVRVIHDHPPYSDSINVPTSDLVLEDEQSEGPKSVYFLDVASGRITGRVKAPTADARVKAISAPSKRVAFLYRRNNVDIIAVRDASGASRDVLRLNEFQKDKEIGTFVKIDHGGAKDDQKLISWLLLPPGYRDGPPLPTVVQIYPGIAYGPVPPQVNPNDKTLLLAAHGYAVLFASLPVDRSVLPREPLQGLADAVLRAVDAAISRHYVDGAHLAIQGQSYGGGGTLGVIGQTDRFKAAVSVAGVFNFLSMYGQPEISDRLTGEFDGILFTVLPMAWSETGALGMGVPPWNDPQRYLRNSPLLHVGTINTPTMLVHGDLDNLAPFTQSEEMFTALYRLSKDAVFVRYWGEGHAVPVSPANIRDYWRRIYSWYDHYIGPPFQLHEEFQATVAGRH